MQVGPLRDSFATVDFHELRAGFRGREYRELVQDHMRKMGSQLELSMQGAVDAMHPHEKLVAEQMIDEINIEAHNQSFWRSDCAATYQKIAARFTSGIEELGQTADEVDVFNVFQLITMNLAATARDNRPLRVHANIRKSMFIR